MRVAGLLLTPRFGLLSEISSVLAHTNYNGPYDNGNPDRDHNFNVLPSRLSCNGNDLLHSSSSPHVRIRLQSTPNIILPIPALNNLNTFFAVIMKRRENTDKPPTPEHPQHPNIRL